MISRQDNNTFHIDWQDQYKREIFKNFQERDNNCRNIVLSRSGVALAIILHNRIPFETIRLSIVACILILHDKQNSGVRPRDIVFLSPSPPGDIISHPGADSAANLLSRVLFSILQRASLSRERTKDSRAQVPWAFIFNAAVYAYHASC